MSLPYRLLLFDLDATLLGPDRLIRPATLEVLARLEARGVLASLATGRSPRSAVAVVHDFVPSAPAIHFNGAVIRDWRTGEDLLHRHLALEDALAATAVARGMGVHVNLYLEDEILVERRSAVSAASETKDGVPHRRVGDFAALLAGTDAQPTKLLCIGQPSQFGAFAAEVQRVTHADCAVVNSEPDYFEVLPPGVNKGAGVVALAELLGIELAQVIAFGDNLNDLELLEVAGLGVAMGDGHPELLARTDTVIGPHDRDSIACFLEETFGMTGS